MKTTFRIFVTFALLLSLCLTTVAVDFTPSVEVKLAPEVVEVEYEGKPVAAELIDINTGDVVDGVPMYDPSFYSDDTILEFFIIPFSELKDAALEDISEGLLDAVKQIKAAPLVTDLCEGLEEQILRQIELYYLGEAYYGNNGNDKGNGKGNGKGNNGNHYGNDKNGDNGNHYGNHKIRIEDLIISHVFDASFVRDRAELVHTVEGQKVRFRIKTNFKKGEFFILLHNTEGTTWRVEEDLELYDDGTLVVTTDHLSVFAFVIEKQPDFSVDPNGPRSPQTGSIEASPRYMYFGISVLCILAAGYLFVKAAKKAKAE